MRARAALAIGLLLTCASCKNRKPPRGPGPIVTLDTSVTGLSGLTRDEAGVLWAAGETDRFFLRIDPASFNVTTYPVVGAPSGADLEAMAWLGEGRFVVGTETQVEGRTKDELLYGSIQGERFVIDAREIFDYGLWDVRAPDNRGIEGLCRVDGLLILATELVEEKHGRRWAPLAVLDLETKTWTAHRVVLTSHTGKLAAIGCRSIEGRAVALAMERHFGVARLLRFDVPAGPTGTWIEPETVTDLSKLIEPLPNFEGLVWDEAGSVMLLTDNHYRGRAPDPSRLYSIPAGVLR